MYCKKCRCAIPDNELICPKCNFDNENKGLSLNEIANINSKNNSHMIHKLATLLISCILVIIGSIMLFSTFSKAKTEDDESLKLTYTTYTIDNLSFRVSSLFGTSTNTIFYKTNTDININIKEATEGDLNSILKEDNYQEEIINGIKTKKLKDSYIVSIDEKHYLIKINSVEDKNIFTEEIKKEIDSIINSMQKKDA